MSDREEGSEQERELTGIARAVDALFRHRRPSTLEKATAPADEPPPLPVGPNAPTDEPPPLPVGSDAPADEPAPSPADVHPSQGEQVSHRRPASPIDPPVPSFGEPTTSGESTTFGESTTSHDPTTHPPEVAAGAGPSSTGSERRADSDSVEPTLLDEAVAAFLDGTGSAAEVTRLAEEMLEENVIDPVARAVTSLVLAAGEPPDAGLLAIAERLMSPIVLGRMVRRLAAGDDPDGRSRYVRVARTIGRPMAMAIRDDLAESVDPDLRDGHVAALVGLDERARSVVLEMAESDNRFLVRTGVEVLGVMGGAGALPPIRNALTNPDARVRRQALRSLMALEDRDAESLITAMLGDPDGQVRTTAAKVVAELGFPGVVGKVMALLEESTVPDETIGLLDALGHLGDPEAVPAIEKHAVRTLFSKPPTEVRIAAYGALHRIGTPHATRLLQQAASDKDPRVGAFVNGLVVGR